MKLRVRFLLFFSGGLFLFLLYMGAITSLVFGAIIPLFHLTAGGDSTFLITFGQGDESLIFIITFLFSFVSGGFLLSQYFVKPLLYILSLVKQLSLGNYNFDTISRVIYKNGTLKRRYFLYKEILADLISLADTLESAKTESSRLELSKRNWINGISHDLKTPLSYIIGYSALLKNQEYTWEKEESDNFLAEIYEKGKYIEQLVGDMNLIYNIEAHQTELPLHREALDLVPYLQKLTADISNNPEAASYFFSIHSGEKSLWLEADPRLLYRAFQNLLINAVHHNQKGTGIKIEILKSDNSAKVLISDNGAGLTPALVDMINESCSFQNNASSYTGKGLGLGIAKSIIKAHDGIMSVDSSPGSGTAFCISLPIKRPL